MGLVFFKIAPLASAIILVGKHVIRDHELKVAHHAVPNTLLEKLLRIAYIKDTIRKQYILLKLQDLLDRYFKGQNAVS